MIIVADNVTRIEGDPKQIMTELTLLLSSFKETLKKEYKMSEEDCNKVLAKSCEIAFMDNWSRKQMLDDMESENVY